MENYFKLKRLVGRSFKPPNNRVQSAFKFPINLLIEAPTPEVGKILSNFRTIYTLFSDPFLAVHTKLRQIPGKCSFREDSRVLHGHHYLPFFGIEASFLNGRFP